MRNILRRPRTRVVVATALAGGLVLGAAAAAHADFNRLRLRQLDPPLRSGQEHAGRVPLTDLTLSWGGCLSARSSATAHEN